MFLPQSLSSSAREHTITDDNMSFETNASNKDPVSFSVDGTNNPKSKGNM